MRAVYDDAKEKLESLVLRKQPVKDDECYSIGVMEFHYSISDKAFGLSNEELTVLGEPEVICTSCLDVLEEYLSRHQNLARQVEGRLVFKAA